MESVTNIAKVKDGKCIEQKNPVYDKFIESVEGKDIFIKYSRMRRQRTGKQNNYIHGVFRRISEHTGHSEDYIKYWMADKFLNKVIVYGIHGQESGKEPVSTASITTVEMIEFVKQIRLFWWDFQELHIPLPEDWNRD